MPVVRRVLATELTDLERVFDDIRRDNDVSEGFPREAYFEAEQQVDGEHAHVSGERLDLEHIQFVTIDPVGARDLDQAVSIERDGTGFLIRYAIADVAAHVEPGGALDRATHKRVETIYCPDRRVPLHPAVLSEGYASLLAGQRAKAAVWTMRVDADGNLTESVVERAWVRSRAQYSYTQLHEAPPAEAREMCALLREFGDARRALSASRGAVSLPKPSQETNVVDGEVTLEFRLGLPIEDDNAQVSLLTGEAAAALMLEAGVGVLRTMPPAHPRAVTRLRHQARALGVTWRDSDSYAEMLPGLDKEAPETAAFLVQAITLFRDARWEPFIDGSPDDTLHRPEQLLHGALGVPYAHVTAPLRRLVDRYGTEVCLAHCAGRPVPQWVLDRLPELGQTMASGVRKSKRVDRACIDAVESAVLAPHVGEEFDGVGLDEDTVQLANPAVVARCSGQVRPGEVQRVRLESAPAHGGPRFSVTDSSPGAASVPA